jgi:F-type H+-transporting ATPase subunit gamma
MASLKEVKGRINSVKSTMKITSAMKMVASAKLHHAQSAITNMLPYEQKLDGILTTFLSANTDYQSVYTSVRPVHKLAIIAFSSNSSLCGAFNSNVVRLLNDVTDSYKELTKNDITVYPIGKKIAKTAQKAGYQISGDYEAMADKPNYKDVAALASDIMGKYADGEYDKVEIIYHHFISSATQVLLNEVYLPLQVNIEQEGPMLDYIVEPSSESLLKVMIPQVIALRMFTALLDSNASEHAARMMAMQMATDNGDKLLQELTIQYNKSRQQSITNELLDIIGGSLK